MTKRSGEAPIDPKLVPVASSVVEMIFEMLDQDAVDEILIRTKEINEESYKRLKDAARKAGKL